MKLLNFGWLVLILAGHSPAALAQCEPLFGKLLINELMAGNDGTAADEFGEFDDWIEIYNASGEAVQLEGYFLSDSRATRTKYAFPNTVLPADSYLIIWCDNQPEQGAYHAAFNLSGSGEKVGLYDTDTATVDFVSFGSIPDDITIGRFPNGSGPFKILIPTFASANTNSVNPGVVINEYQAINESTVQDQWGGYEDWIELYNNSPQPINLGGWFLSDKIGEPAQFVFPDTTMAPNSYLIIWCDQGLFEPGLHTFFKLGADGDDILLSNPDTLTVDYVKFGPQIPDDSEGRFGNGTGSISCMIPSFSETNGFPLSIAQKAERKPLKIWPNPSSGSATLSSELNKPDVLKVYDLAGRNVAEFPIMPFINNQNLNFDLPTGSYVLVLGESTAKFVILP